MKKISLLCLILGTLFSCAPKNITQVEKTEPTFPNQATEQGAQLYAQNCGKCHRLFEISEFPKERWDKVLPPMIKKARLSEEDGLKVTEFVYWKLSATK